MNDYIEHECIRVPCILHRSSQANKGSHAFDIWCDANKDPLGCSSALLKGMMLLQTLTAEHKCVEVLTQLKEQCSSIRAKLGEGVCEAHLQGVQSRASTSQARAQQHEVKP